MRPAWQYVVPAVLCYACTYLACRKWLARDRTPEFSCRVVTLIHAVSSVALSAYCCLKLGPFPFTTSDVPFTFVQSSSLSSSMGYFLFDLSWCLWHHHEGVIMLMHHIVSIATLGRALHSGKNGTEYLCGVGLLEVTNPALQARWFLRTLGYHNKTPFYVADWIFITEFILVRIVYGTYLLIRMLQLDRSMREYFCSFVCIYVISCVFFLGIVRYVWRKYIMRSSRGLTGSNSDSATINEESN